MGAFLNEILSYTTYSFIFFSAFYTFLMVTGTSFFLTIVHFHKDKLVVFIHQSVYIILFFFNGDRHQFSIIRIKIKLKSYDPGKTINTFSHVGTPCSYIDLFKTCTVIEHDTLPLIMYSKMQVMPGL